MALQIKIDQSGASAGVAGQAREDLVVGTPVTLAAVGGPFLRYEWSLLDAPTDDTVLVASDAAFTAAQSPTTSLAPIDNEGTYAVQLKVDSGAGLGARLGDTVRITFAAFDSDNPIDPDGRRLPQRMPSFAERTEHNVADGVEATGNTKGWSRTMRRWFEIVKRVYRGKAWAWAYVNVSGGAATIKQSAIVVGNAFQRWNVASVDYVAVGKYDVNLDEPFALDAAFPVMVFPQDLVGGNPVIGARDLANSTLSKIRVEIRKADGTMALIDGSFLVVAWYNHLKD